MDGNTNAQLNNLFQLFSQAEQSARRQSEQNVYVAGGQDAQYLRSSTYESTPSANTSTQSVAGSTPQMAQKEISLSLLQTLLKTQQQQQPAAATTAQGPMSVAELEKSLAQAAGAQMFASIPQQVPTAKAFSPIEQLKRMAAAQNFSVGGGRAEQQATSVTSDPEPLAASMITSPSSMNSSPSVKAASVPLAASTSQQSGRKKPRVNVLNIDAKRIKARGTPESTPISMLQQPARFKPGRLVAVSRDYICYAVRTKEGGRVRIIHQLHGQRAMMVGHTNSIIDMAFHPCSGEPGRPQVLASVGKDNRLIVWSVGPVDDENGSVEGAIDYEPFINVDSGGDARFSSVAWRPSAHANTLELVVSTDKGFMLVKAPMPAAEGERAEPVPGDQLHIMPVLTDSPVTAVACGGTRWVFVAFADKTVQLYDVSHTWETSSTPYTLVGEVAQCSHPVDTLYYIEPTTASDKAGHILAGYSMNRHLQLWWLGSRAGESALIHAVNFVGMPHRPSHGFVSVAYEPQARIVVGAASNAPSVIFSMKVSGHGSSMHLNFPQGQALAEDQATLSMAAAYEGDAGLSVYAVHTRLVQQLQIQGIRATDYEPMPDPADSYAARQLETGSEKEQEDISLEVDRIVDRVNSIDIDRDTGMGSELVPEASPSVPDTFSIQPPQLPQPPQELLSARSPQATPSSGIAKQELAAEIRTAVNESIAAQHIPAQVSAAVASALPTASLQLSPEAEQQLVDKISAVVERKVVQDMAGLMEATLIPAYSRATTAMFEQMKSTFEAGLQEWWMRFAQVMPPPPPPIATPLAHASVPQQPPMPPPPQGFSQPPVMSPVNANYLESLKNLLNGQKPKQ
ncbi:hypothetical protein DL89DRAFT_321124 [Linderina pennispora]|uniref:Uncharacterized protein n=1 Tax=Linderina pennispora TaxID=61395 RepID=A0A1Y1WEM7_9FUNG|nr:uncharacterized protein DL89DRAFT_321124 [Linderina pennispora]ORX71980.1 hypothetical protein DL89DRAFT_321124 [Linderina pennispora]